MLEVKPFLSLFLHAILLLPLLSPYHQQTEAHKVCLYKAFHTLQLSLSPRLQPLCLQTQTFLASVQEIAAPKEEGEEQWEEEEEDGNFRDGCFALDTVVKHRQTHTSTFRACTH